MAEHVTPKKTYFAYSDPVLQDSLVVVRNRTKSFMGVRGNMIQPTFDRPGEANLFEARVIEGLSDGEIQQLFKAARDEDYEAIASEARSLDREDLQRLALDIARLRKRISDVQAIDFFGAPKGQLAVAVVEELARTIEEPAQASSETERSETYRDRTWVTRAGVHVDRMASAWLIRRFVDPEAHFKFVTEKQYAPKDGEVRFDMFNAEFTHEGDRCTFEVLIDRMRLDDPALRAIGRGTFAQSCAFGCSLRFCVRCAPSSVVPGGQSDVAIMSPHGDERIARAAAVLEDLYVYYQKKR